MATAKWNRKFRDRVCNPHLQEKLKARTKAYYL